MKILFVTNSVPYPPTDGVRIKTYNLLKQLSKKHELYLLSFYRKGVDSFREISTHLEQLCTIVKLIPHNKKKFRNIGALLNLVNPFVSKPFFAKEYESEEMRKAVEGFLRNKEIDIIHFDTLGAGQYIEAVKDTAAVLSLNDSLALSYMDEARLYPAKNFIKKIKSIMHFLEVYRYEKELCGRFQKCHVVSELDRQYLHKMNGQIDVEVIPNGVDTDFYRPLRLEQEYPSLVFEGGMGGGAADYAIWFIDYVLGLVRKSIPDIKLYLVGKNPDKKLFKIAAESKNIIVTGFVDDVRPYVDRATIFVCPVLRSSGILNKVLQAMAMEKAVVGTHWGFSGIKGCAEWENMLSAKTAEEFAAAIVELLNNEDKRKTLGKNARLLVRNNYSWEKTAEGFERLYEKAIGQSCGLAGDNSESSKSLRGAAACKN